MYKDSADNWSFDLVSERKTAVYNIKSLYVLGIPLQVRQSGKFDLFKWYNKN